MNKNKIALIAGVILLICFVSAAGCISTMSSQTPSQSSVPAQVDVPSQSGVPASSQSAGQGQITLEEAKSIALRYAGFSANQVTFTKTELDYENGFRVYEIEFYSGSDKYEYEVDAASGNIVKSKKESYYVQQGQPSSQQGSGSYISAERAKEIGLDFIVKTYGISRDSVYGNKSKLDSFDDDYGRAVYELKFYTNPHHMEYEVDIDAVTGSILKCKADYD